MGHPLLMFYILLIMSVLLGTVSVVCMVEMDRYDVWQPFMINMPATLKSMVGFEQIWIMTELSLRISYGQDQN